jgi:hypothetical protein
MTRHGLFATQVTIGMGKSGSDSPGYEHYRLFCKEILVNDSGFPQINSIKPIFEKLAFDEFIGFSEKILEAENYDLMTQFFYFLLLFRDMPHLQKYINSGKFNIAYLEKFIIFVNGFCSLHEQTTGRIIDDVLYFISRERLLDLVMNSQYIARDKLLLFFILTKLDTKELNTYFSSLKDISTFKSYFVRLPDVILKTMISRNYQLFQYIMMLMMDGDTEGTSYADFFNKYRGEMEQFSKLHDFIRQYKNELVSDTDKDLPFNKRDMSRISFLVNTIKDLPNPEKAIQYFNSESVFIDEFEKKIIHAIVTNPVLRNVFNDHENMHDGKQGT